MKMDLIKIINNKLDSAHRSNDLYFLANINNIKEFELLTNLQKKAMLIVADDYQHNVYKKLETGKISPKDMSFNSCALKCGAAYTYYLRRYWLPLYQEKPSLAKQLASEIFDHIAANPYLSHKGKWNEYFLIILGG